MSEPLLKVQDLKIHFSTFYGVAKAVDGISFEVQHGEALGLVGESGSGKSVTGMAILQLIQPPGKVVAGDIIFAGKSLVDYSEKEMQNVRGSKISMIFQNPRTCLNPVLTLGRQIDRVYLQHNNVTPAQASEHRLEMLSRVGIGDPIRFSNNYPHQVSGGMCQRAMIVMAIICEPQLVIADEPTTGLDVTIQRQIMELLAEMRERMNETQILITHDLGVVAETCHRIVVMYASRVMEVSPTRQLFNEPLHPYTIGLLNSIPRVDIDEQPTPLPGYVPNALNRPSGCPFHPRCSRAQERCQVEQPELVPVKDGRSAACFFVEK
ncbi:MAG: peptide ABC transporter ATP-binding protein [Chloroflexi bacterium GWB2_49_20]|nr:MAG: peptide ABC transporter ATP-binding protein [Chloroflexi bacterium GWB2_49_20]OGN79704.1 MAG: peptide ABC transporter ATP-binding protein [Chloroflexi bacterium GWC2_49_37]OGN85952.1 MAG: peptide ABC transporter ATP-binding protein [Chloroflexi bacterium GWD2_49_16]HBG73988.1 peptide ABC transporter ATP-binding protein [Anaerolineae bacterium]HCC78746.1 peptide ABC transporter ATP-binding protein [Anaerolineae bacterium]